MEKIFEKEDLNRRDEIQRVKKDIEKAEARRSNLQDLILDGTISPQDYQDMKEKVDKDLVLLKSKLSELMDQPSPYKTYISNTVPMLENLTGYYKAADGQTKRKILGCIFSEKLVFEKVLLRDHLPHGFDGQRKLRRIIEELQPPPSRNPYRFCSRLPRFYKGLKIEKNESACSRMI